MIITSLENEKVKKYRKLQSKKYREEYKEYIIEGEHLVLEAYKKGVLKELILREDSTFFLDCPTVYFTKEIMDKISTMDTSSSIMGLCSMNNSYSITGEKILILDDIQDPGNLGTIIRSALAFNIDTVVLSLNTVDLYNPKVLRATQGMFFHINIVREDLFRAIDEIKSRTIPVYGTSVVNGEDARLLDNSKKEKYALVVGNEGNGVRKDILSRCDKNLYINMNSHVESLNVAIATSILLYELGR